MRVYVLVTSFYPLIVYIYSDGLARFAVHEYNEENRKNYSDVNAHLTNYSLNKYSSQFIKYIFFILTMLFNFLIIEIMIAHLRMLVISGHWAHFCANLKGWDMIQKVKLT